MKVQKILLISHSQLMGGAERCLIDLCEGLYFRGYSLTIVVPSKGPNFELFKKYSKDIYVISYPWWLINKLTTFQFARSLVSNFYAFCKLIKLYRKIKPEVVLNNTIAVPSGAFAAKFLKIPLVWFIHEFGDKDHGFNFLLGKKTTLRMINFAATEIIVNSGFLRNFYIDNGLTKPIIVAPLSIDLVATKNDKLYNFEERRHNLKIYVVGQVQEGKGQLIVLEAFRRLLAEYQTAQLFIIGQISNSEYYTKLVSFVKLYSLDNYVHFHPHLSNPFELIDGFSIGVVASNFEAFGRITIEYMKLRVPVIASNCENNSNLIQHGKNGLLFIPGDATSLLSSINNLINLSALDLGNMLNNAEKYANDTYNMNSYVSSVQKVLHRSCNEEI